MVYTIIVPTPEHPGTDASIELKSKKENGLFVPFNKPCILAQMDATETSKFLTDVVDIRSEIFLRHCLTGKQGRAEKLLKRGRVDCNWLGMSGREWPPFMQCVYRGQVSIVKWFVEFVKTDVNYVSPVDNWTALHCACSKGYLEIVEYLLEHGASTEIVTITGESPVSLAAQNKHDHVLNRLVGPDGILTKRMIEKQGKRLVERRTGMFTLLPSMAPKKKILTVADNFAIHSVESLP